LTALKKLEEDAPPQEASASAPRKVDARRSVLQRIRRVKGEWLINRLFVGSLALILLVLGVWMILSNRASSDSVTSHQTQLASLSAEGRPGTDVVASGKIEHSTPESPASSARKADSQSAHSETGIQHQDSPEQTEPPGTETQEAPGSVLQAETTGIDESGLKLEAIVWSNKDENCFAVINGQILRAGQTIDGASVTKIDRDYVTLESGDHSCRLRFRPE
jgi:hypothetical protein